MLRVIWINSIWILLASLWFQPRVDRFANDLQNGLSNYHSFKTTYPHFKVLYRRYYEETELVHWCSKKLFNSGLCLWGSLIFFLALNHIFWALCVFFVPLLLLEQRLLIVNRNIDLAMIPFFTKINASLIKHQDLITALKSVEKTMEQKTLYSGIRAFNVAIHSGISAHLAFKKLYESTKHPYLKYVYLNIEQAYLKRGDLVQLIGSLEEEYLLIRVERNKRIAEVHNYLNLTWLAVGILGFSAFNVYNSNDYIFHYYQNNPTGKNCLLFLVFLVALALLILLKAIRHPVE